MNIYIYICIIYICIYIYRDIYMVFIIHIEVRLFHSIKKVCPSGIRTHDLVLTVHRL